MLKYILPLVLMPMAAHAVTLDLPGLPQMTHDQSLDGAQLMLPTGPWRGGQEPHVVLTGQLSKQAWHSDGKINVINTMQKLVAQLENDGYQILLSCTHATCGGFEFRFAQDIIAPPAMYVDLGNYAFVSARDGQGAGVTLLVSGTRNGAYYHVASINEMAEPPVLITPPQHPDPGIDPTLEHALNTKGKAVLSDLAFQSGSADLETGDYTSLIDLADYMLANPQVAIALVGHTDTTGALQANITLSRQRADAVRRVLVGDFGINPARVVADGIGYLAPRASNTTPEGREQNRRVEAVAIPRTD